MWDIICITFIKIGNSEEMLRISVLGSKMFVHSYQKLLNLQYYIIWNQFIYLNNMILSKYNKLWKWQYIFFNFN
jgi:hypothetical protein